MQLHHFNNCNNHYPEVWERPKGHYIRMDVLVSALEKGIQKNDVHLALWSLASLCRANAWKFALERLCLSWLQDSNIITEPHFYLVFFRMLKRLRPQIERHGVNIATSAVVKLFFELAVELCSCMKSRMVYHAQVTSYQILAEEIKDIKEHCGIGIEKNTDNNDVLMRIFLQFRNAFESRTESDCLKWASVMDLLGANNDVYGIDKIWRYLQQSKQATKWKDAIDTLYTIWEWCRPWCKLQQIGRLLLYQAILVTFYPNRNLSYAEIAPSRRTVVIDKNHSFEKEWEFWEKLTSPNTVIGPEWRNHIDWSKWLPIILDSSTASGKNRDTLSELRHQVPDFPVLEYSAPDYSGVTHPSLTQHDFTVCFSLVNKTLADTYEIRARHFFSQLERGHSLPIFRPVGAEMLCVETIRSKLCDLFQLQLLASTDADTDTNTDVKNKTPKRKLERSKSYGRLPSLASSSLTTLAPTTQLSLSTQTQTQTRPRAGSSDPVRSHAVSKAPQGLPGFLVEFQAVLSPPLQLDGKQVICGQLAEMPVIGTPPRWFITLSDRSQWIVQQYAEMKSTVPIHFDRIKSKFGLTPLSIRWQENWLLISNPSQKSAPYPTTIQGPKRYETVNWHDAGLYNLAQTNATNEISEKEKSSWSVALLDQLTKTLLFRALFRVETTQLNHFFCTADDTLYSFFESCPTQTALPECPSHLLTNQEKAQWLLSALFPLHHEFSSRSIPISPYADWLIAYWTQDKVRAQVLDYLNQWEIFIPDLPLPNRPVLDFPHTKHLLHNLQTLRDYW